MSDQAPKVYPKLGFDVAAPGLYAFSVPAVAKEVLIQLSGPDGQWMATMVPDTAFSISAMGDSPKKAFLQMQEGYFDWLLQNSGRRPFA
jgi:hypothetical protein